MNVKIKLIDGGILPEMKRDGDACFDCYSNIDVNIEPNDRFCIPLGFALELPKGYEAVIRPRSGHSVARIDAMIGTIDSNYRGEVKGIIQNNTGKTIGVRKGDRICQMAIRKTEEVIFEVVEELSETNRGENGFGSSGQ